jgi:transposase-like protein
MGRARTQDRPHDDNDGTWSVSPDPRVESLRQRFARFRRDHRPGTRYPPELRAAVLAALRSGAVESVLRRACGVSSVQLAAWRRGEVAAGQSSALARPPARVFSVVDEPQPAMSLACASHPVGEDVELRIGGWSVRLRWSDG